MAMITTSIQALQAALPGKRIWELDITRRGRPYIHEKLEAELGITDDQQPIPLLAVLNTCGLSDAVWALRATAVDPSLLRQYLCQTLVELRMVFVDHPYLLETLALTRKLLQGEFDAVGWETQFMACRAAFLAKDSSYASGPVASVVRPISATRTPLKTSKTSPAATTIGFRLKGSLSWSSWRSRIASEVLHYRCQCGKSRPWRDPCS